MALVDTHGHLTHEMSAERLVREMDGAGVAAMVLMPVLYQSGADNGRATDKQAASYAQGHPGRFVPFIGGQRDNLGPASSFWNNPDSQNTLSVMKSELSGGGYFGIGEFILRHHAYKVAGNETGGEVTAPIDSYGLYAIAKLAAQFHVPVLFHAEAEPEPAAQAERLFAANPDTSFIWAHNCGRASAEDVGRRLQRFPNLRCDLGSMCSGPYTACGYGDGWPRQTQWVHVIQETLGAIRPEMRQLFETWPDRFSIGSDIAHAPVLESPFSNYRTRMDLFRVMLGQLSPATAQKIGADNARRLFAAALPGAPLAVQPTPAPDAPLQAGLEPKWLTFSNTAGKGCTPTSSFDVAASATKFAVKMVGPWRYFDGDSSGQFSGTAQTRSQWSISGNLRTRTASFVNKSYNDCTFSGSF
jgi:hypothetical protein